jgi:hypothetical protein
MEQRRLRLGDILDDYCPRERRVTNHAVVAMIEEDVKQTRCTTCDAEHAYKGGKEPRRRKKDSTAVLYKEVLAGMPETPELVSPVPAAPEPAQIDVRSSEDTPEEPPAEVATEYPNGPEQPPTPGPDSSGSDEGPFHRRLIRATLPRPEGQKDVRQIPEFTIRQNGGRNGHGSFRGGSKMRSHGGNGNRPQGGGRRFGSGGHGPSGQGRGPSAGSGRGGRPGFGGGNPQRQGAQGGRNRKRSR